MAFAKKFGQMLSATAIIIVGTSSLAVSQEQAVVTAESSKIIETFEGNDTTLMLGGQIAMRDGKSPWLVYVTDGQLVMENRQDPTSIRYNDIAWVKFPDSDMISTTENLSISAVVDASNEGRGGAGILVGSGKANAYLMFAVDSQGKYHVIRKQGLEARAMHTAKHDAINVDGPNTLSFEVQGGNVAFFVNAQQVIKIPYLSRFGKPSNGKNQSGITLAAFGLGKFNFDDVEIMEQN